MEKLLIVILVISNILLLIKCLAILVKAMALYFYIADNCFSEPTIEKLEEYQEKVIQICIKKIFKR